MFGRQCTLKAHDGTTKTCSVANKRAAPHHRRTCEIPQSAAQRGKTKHRHRVPIADGKRIQRQRFLRHNNEGTVHIFTAEADPSGKIGGGNGQRPILVGDDQRFAREMDDAAGKVRCKGDSIGPRTYPGVADGLAQGAGAAVGQSGDKRRG